MEQRQIRKVREEQRGEMQMVLMVGWRVKENRKKDFSLRMVLVGVEDDN